MKRNILRYLRIEQLRKKEIEAKSNQKYEALADSLRKKNFMLIDEMFETREIDDKINNLINNNYDNLFDLIFKDYTADVSNFIFHPQSDIVDYKEEMRLLDEHHLNKFLSIIKSKLLFKEDIQ